MTCLKMIVAAVLTAATGAQAQDFVVSGTSGNEIVLDRMWDRGCLPGTGGNDWTLYQRTLTGLSLTTTLTDFQNGSATPNCESGRVGFAEYTQELTIDNVMVPITWVDFNFEPAAAPEGLEGVTMANGATGLIVAAKVIPEVQARVDQLNGAAFCGATDWHVGVSQPTEVIIECFTGGFNPGKGTIVVDDSSLPWKIYDGLGQDPTAYPAFMPNYAPHSGPFPP